MSKILIRLPVLPVARSAPRGVVRPAALVAALAATTATQVLDGGCGRRVMTLFIDAGALCWPNGLELSPARLHEISLLGIAA